MTEGTGSKQQSTASTRGRLRHVIARNVFWNWAGTAVEMAAGFLIAPYLVRRLGTTGYGLWIVIGSLSGYFSLIDLGLRGSVGRQLAFHRAHDNRDEANRILSSALAILSSISILTVVATVVAVGLFDRVFDTPANLLPYARMALLLVGFNLAISFPLQVFDGNLWAAQRFDALNFVDIPATIARVGLTFAFVRDSKDIIALAIITLVTTVVSGGLKAFLSFRYDRALRVHPRYLSRASGQSLFGYGVWNFVLTVARLTKTQLSPLLIGAFLGIHLVTPFSIARRLQDYAHKVLWTATGVVVPIATRFHAREELKQQQNLFIEGGKYSTAAAVFFLGYFVCLGQSLIALWMGRAFAYVSALLIILCGGEFLQMTQSATGSIILAKAKHKTLAWLAVAEAIVSIAALSLTATRFGLEGVCLALAVPQALFSGLAMILYGCRIAEVSLARYCREALLPSLVAGAVPVGILAVVTHWRPALSWPTLLVYSAAYSLVYAVACWGVLKPIASFGTGSHLSSALLTDD
jgi:O-antigen/teichoic acid export membrane protein